MNALVIFLFSSCAYKSAVRKLFCDLFNDAVGNSYHIGFNDCNIVNLGNTWEKIDCGLM
jgi:hypothetical protein